MSSGPGVPDPDPEPEPDPDPDPVPSAPAPRPRPRRPQRDRGRGRASSTASSPAQTTAALGRPGRGGHSPRSARRRRRALLGASPGDRGAVPRAAARALFSGRRPPRRLLGHCRRLPRRAGGPGAGPASAAQLPLSPRLRARPRGLGALLRAAPHAAVAAPLPLPLARGRLTRRAGAAGPPAQTARAWSSRRAACSARRRRPVRLRGGGGGAARSPGCVAPAPAASPPRGRGASLGAREVPASPRLCPCLPAWRGGAEPGPRGQRLRARRARQCRGAGGLSPNPCEDGEAAAARKTDLGPAHVEQITGWKEMEAPSPRGGGPGIDPGRAFAPAAPAPGGGAPAAEAGSGPEGCWRRLPGPAAPRSGRGRGRRSGTPGGR